MVVSHLKRGATIFAFLVGAETAYAVLRPSPHLPDFDPSGEFGDTTKPELRVAVLGDSSVTAPGVEGPDEIWIRIVCHRLAETHHVLLNSFAVGGSRASDLIENQLDRAIDFDPDLAFVAVGANDVIKAVPLRQFEENLDALVRRLVATRATVILSGVGDLGTIPRLYPPLSSLITRRSLRFDQAHWRVAKRFGCYVVPHRSDDRRLWTRDLDLWSPDLFHVSANGHRRWADYTWKTVEPLVAATDG